MSIRVPRTAASLLASLSIRILGHTWRIEWRGLDRLERARRLSSQVVYAFWHGRLLVLSFTHRHREIQVLASEHPDGDLMGRTIEWLGFGHLKGSTSKGGARALRGLSAVLREGLDVGLTVDGPRGPRGVVHQGAIELGRLTGSAVVPITNAARPRKIFGSWDRFQLPAPFAKVIIAHGEPIVVPDDADPLCRERLRVGLQEELHRLTTDLDAELGHRRTDGWPHADD